MKVNRAIGTRNFINILIKGLGKYTIESHIICFKSLLRGSVLYAAEAMVNLKEKEIIIIEKSEELTLQNLESSAPRHLIYVELNILSEMYVICDMHLKRILSQDKDSLTRKVFNAQVKTLFKGDWTSEVRRMLKELKIYKTFEAKEAISKINIATIIRLAVKKRVFEYLISIQKQKLKGQDNKYKQFKIQAYFWSIKNIDLGSQR